MKKLTRERVVPTMSASVPWLIFHKPMARGAEIAGNNPAPVDPGAIGAKLSGDEFI